MTLGLEAALEKFLTLSFETWCDVIDIYLLHKEEEKDEN